jgi:glycosyltransferase involved in cell wall biosynthesis
MIIGIDASRANRPHKTGTEWYSFYLIKNLALIDRTNQYRLYLNTPPTPELAEIIKGRANFSFKFLSWPFGSFWTLGRLSLEMLIARPDVIFIPAHTMPLFSPRRTVNTIHDIAFVREQNLYRSRKIKVKMAFSRRLINFFIQLITFGKYRSDSVDYLYWSTAFALRRAGKIITVSDFTRQEIISLYPKAKSSKIQVVHNGYNNQLFRPIHDQEKINSVLSKYSIESPYFLYVGRLEKKKNTPSLIEALALIRENNPAISEKLILIGDASFGYDEVKYAIDDFNLDSQVIMPGWVAEEDLPYIFNGASAFIFPSKHEGFGIPLLQAMACGIPVAASNISVFKEVADQAVLYFDQRDKYSIAAAMKTIVENKALRQELIAKGRQRVMNFSWEKCARETLKELENW